MIDAEFTTTNEREAHMEAARLEMTEGVTSVSLVGFDIELDHKGKIVKWARSKNQKETQE